MKKFVVKGGTLLDLENNYLFQRADILVENGIIQRIGPDLQEDCETVDAEGLLVSPGMIDIHVHTRGAGSDFTPADVLGYRRGTTAIIECGTVAASDVESFARETQFSKTKQFALLGAHSDAGMVRGDECGVEKTHFEIFEDAFHKYPDILVGLKCACSASITADKGYGLVKNAKEMAEKLQVPVTVHIGRFPPDPCGLVEILGRGDVMTHIYHDKEVSVFFPDGTPKSGFARARERGVLFDVGHGRESFSWRVCAKALQKGFLPDLIGTDIYAANMDGPVYSLAMVMSKVVNLGMPLEDAVYCVTGKAAKTYHLKNLGQLHSGFIADFTLFTLDECEIAVEDSYGEVQPMSKIINPRKVVISHGETSRLYECDQGHFKTE